MPQLLHLSRNFVEFGPFTEEEIQIFKARAILSHTDFLRAEGSDEWIPVEHWSFTTAFPVAETPETKKAKSTPPKKAPAKAAKKAAKKAATQAAKP